MSDENLKNLVAQGLSALKTGSDIAAKATGEINNDSSDLTLKEALRQGNDASKHWANGIERAVQQVGGGQQNNPILKAHYEVSRKIRQQAPNAVSRDLGIVASGHSHCITGSLHSARWPAIPNSLA